MAAWLTALSSRRHFKFCANVNGHFRRIIVNEVSDFVVRDALQLGPLAKGANRGLLTVGKDAAQAKTDDVCKLAHDRRRR